jgi:hypothetical protein
MYDRFTNRLTWSEIVPLYRLSVPPERNLDLPGYGIGEPRFAFSALGSSLMSVRFVKLWRVL